MTRTEPPTRVDTRPGPITRNAEFLLLFAVVLFGVAVRPGPTAAIAVLLATLLLLRVVALRRSPPHQNPSGDWLDRRLLVAVVLFGMLGVVGWSPSALGPSSTALERLPGLLWIGLAAIVFMRRRSLSRPTATALVVATLTLTAILGVAHINAIGNQGIDVYLLHIEAADALADGDNPYTEAVSVPNGSPTADPEDTIDGYVYPPITGFSYALSHWLTPDTRYASLVAWLVVLAIVGGLGVRARRTAPLYLMLLLASVPGWWFVLRAAWTEPLSLMFMAIAVAVWRWGSWSGMGLGAMLASKQYFFVTGPLALLHRDRVWKSRLVAAVAMVVITVGAALVWDVSAFWEAAVAFHTTTPPRTDASNLVGLFDVFFDFTWDPPTLLPLAAGLGVATWAGLRSKTRSTFVLGLAASLAASFMVSSQAFANYWFLVFGMSVMALLPDPDETTS